MVGCASDGNLLSLGPPDHCFAAFTRLVKSGDAVEVWEKRATDERAGGREVRVVRMRTSVNGKRQDVQCTYPRIGPSDAIAIQVDKRRLSADEVAALNAAVRNNQDPGAQVRKALPSPPDIGPLTLDPPGTGTRKK